MNIRTIVLTCTCLLWCFTAMAQSAADGTVSTTGATQPPTFLHVPAYAPATDSLCAVGVTLRPGLLALAGLWRTTLAVRPANQNVIRLISLEGCSAPAWLETSVGAIAGLTIDDGVEVLVGLAAHVAGARSMALGTGLTARLACRWTMGTAWSGALAVDGITIASTTVPAAAPPTLAVGAAWDFDGAGTTIALDGVARADAPLALLCTARVPIAPGVVVTPAFRTWPQTLRVGISAEADRQISFGCSIDHHRHLGWLPGTSLVWQW